MLNLSGIVIQLLNPFAPVFCGATTWERAKLLVIGAILSLGKRTVTSALRAMSLSDEEKFAQYHQVPNRAIWSVLAASRVLSYDPLGEFDSQALLSTDLALAPLQIIERFVLRWRLEVTFEEVRAHLGVETQRQWSALAIARTTPALLGLFASITLLAHALLDSRALPIRSAAWYAKSLPTFSDTIAWVRSFLWQETFLMSPADPDIIKVPRSLLSPLTDTLCYAA